MSLPLDYRVWAFFCIRMIQYWLSVELSHFQGQIWAINSSHWWLIYLFFSFSHCQLLCYAQILKVLFFNANWYILTFLNLDTLTFFTSICFLDVKINITARVKDVRIASRFYQRLVFSYAFCFVKIMHLLNPKPYFQRIFYLSLPCNNGIRWQEWNLHERWLYSSAHHSLWRAYHIHLSYPVLRYQ